MKSIAEHTHSTFTFLEEIGVVGPGEENTF